MAAISISTNMSLYLFKLRTKPPFLSLLILCHHTYIYYTNNNVSVIPYFIKFETRLFFFCVFHVFSHSGDQKAHLVLLSKTADSISDGDLVDRRIRSRQNWSLLPTQVIRTHKHTRAHKHEKPLHN